MPHRSSLCDQSVSKTLKDIVAEKLHKEPKIQKSLYRLDWEGIKIVQNEKRSFDPSNFTGRKQVRKILGCKHRLLFMEKKE